MSVNIDYSTAISFRKNFNKLTLLCEPDILVYLEYKDISTERAIIKIDKTFITIDYFSGNWFDEKHNYFQKSFEYHDFRTFIEDKVNAKVSGVDFEDFNSQIFFKMLTDVDIFLIENLIKAL